MLLAGEGKRVLKATLVGSGHFPSAPSSSGSAPEVAAVLWP